MEMLNPTCPLCESDVVSSFFKNRSREFFECGTCQLVFVPQQFHLSATEEKAVYDFHQNSPDDTRYRAFLSRLMVPVNERIKPKSGGLDFGSGPGPTLSLMFEEAGHSMEIYDPFYSPATASLKKQYDFVTCSEVAEHLCQPAVDLDRMWECVRPAGLLGIMTQMLQSQQQFASWHYKNDPTHVSYFSSATFGWLADRWKADLTIVGNDVAVFTKQHQPDERR